MRASFFGAAVAVAVAAVVLLAGSGRALAAGTFTAPEPDSMGRVHFGPASGEGLGRVTVRAPAADGVRVFLDGRYFGKAPMTIYSVPKGDYIVEGQYADGKQVSRPVSVAENDEATVDLAAGKIDSGGGAKSGIFQGDISPERMKWTKIMLIAGAASLAVGITFGILEMKSESDYKDATTQAQQDDIASGGRRNAAIANVGFILAGGCLVAAAVFGYPLFIKSNAEKPAATISFAPIAAPGPTGMTGGTMVLRF